MRHSKVPLCPPSHPQLFLGKRNRETKTYLLDLKMGDPYVVIFSLQARALVGLCSASTVPTSKLLIKASKVIQVTGYNHWANITCLSLPTLIKILKKGTFWSPSVPHRAPSGHNHLYVKHHFTHHSLAHFVKFSFCNLYFVFVFMCVFFARSALLQYLLF